MCASATGGRSGGRRTNSHVPQQISKPTRHVHGGHSSIAITDDVSPDVFRNAVATLNAVLGYSGRLTVVEDVVEHPEQRQGPPPVSRERPLCRALSG
jgi:hypothetical protein